MTTADAIMEFIYSWECAVSEGWDRTDCKAMLEHLTTLHRMRDEGIWIWVEEQLWERRDVPSYPALTHRDMMP